MAVLTKPFQAFFTRETLTHLDFRTFVSEQITKSWFLTIWLLLLAYITTSVAIGQLKAAPIITGIILLIWVVTVAYSVMSDVTHTYTPVSIWLKGNLYSSITNILITLFLTLVIIAGVRGLIGFTLINASFTTDPLVAEDQATGGAVWGAVIDNLRLLNVFRFSDAPNASGGYVSGMKEPIAWRLYTVIGLLVGLGGASVVVYRDSFPRKDLRRYLTYIWVATPIVSFYLLRGGGPLPVINPDQVWGGLLLTMILSVFAIVVSFPIGLLLALGRRSTIRGIPPWITYPVAMIVAVWGLTTSTPGLLNNSRNLLETVLAYWPIGVLIVAYLFQTTFNGNVVAATSVVMIECTRGVPLITVLFMATVMFPLILPAELEILNTWRVMAGFTLFAAAYLAENVRGGLQSIPKGQYEAADAIGLNTAQKYRFIILPQALRAVIPAIVGQFIGLFKDTSLVAIVGMFDLLNVANTISAQTNWLGHRTEPYLYIFIIYYIGSATMAWYSRRLEKQQGLGAR